jgi:hypothetical protein
MSTLTFVHKKIASPAAALSRIPAARHFNLSHNADAAPENAGHQFNQLSVNNPSLSTGSCPYSIADPRACPTGGVCHLCPGRN